MCGICKVTQNHDKIINDKQIPLTQQQKILFWVFSFSRCENQFTNISWSGNSDKPGEHDFKILKKLVLPDGSVLRARYAGRPTRDCLFLDPVMDGKR